MFVWVGGRPCFEAPKVQTVSEPLPFTRHLLVGLKNVDPNPCKKTDSCTHLFYQFSWLSPAPDWPKVGGKDGTTSSALDDRDSEWLTEKEFSTHKESNHFGP